MSREQRLRALERLHQPPAFALVAFPAQDAADAFLASSDAPGDVRVYVGFALEDV